MNIQGNATCPAANVAARLISRFHLAVIFAVISGSVLHASEEPHFERLWAFCKLGDDEHAAKLAELNVQVAGVDKFTPEVVERARKYGIRPAISIGPSSLWSHSQVISPNEAYVQAELNGRFEPSILSRNGSERCAALLEFVRARGYSFGGEPLPGNVGQEVLVDGIGCFVGEIARSNAVVELTKKLSASPGVGAVTIDYFGYVNYHRCYHPDCEHMYRKFLAEKGCVDTPGNEKEFFLSELVAMNLAIEKAVKDFDTNLVTQAHIYPVYLPEPLYGNRLTYDCIGETCAWYVKWPDGKIGDYAAACATNHPPRYPQSRRVPFIGFTTGDWVARKTADDIERELKAILSTGTKDLMVHEIESVLNDPEVYAVFLKYCGKKQ